MKVFVAPAFYNAGSDYRPRISQNLVFPTGVKWINGDTADANVTTGLVLNQGASDDLILSLKSSDIAHGLTSIRGNVETDTYFAIAKTHATMGGTTMYVYAEDAALGTVLNMIVAGGTAGTVKTTSARALAEITATEHNGSNGVADTTADGNVFAVRTRVSNSDVTRFVVDEDGEGHLVVDAHVLLTDDVEDALMQRAGRILNHPEDHPMEMWESIKAELGMTRREIADWFESRGPLHWHRDEETNEPDFDQEVTIAIRSSILFAWDALWQARQERKSLRERLALTERKLLALEAA